MSTSVTEQEPASRPGSRPHQRQWVALLVLALGGVLIIGGAAFVIHLQDPSGVDHRYEIPNGTGARLDKGEDVAIVPTELHLAPGDKLTITNDDGRVHELGVLSVPSGETVSFAFPNKGVFFGACTLHNTGKLTIYVE